MSKMFADFLKSEHNFKPYEFLLKVKTLEMPASDAERFKLAIYIFNSFIYEGCPKQTNLCLSLVKELNVMFEESKQVDYPTEWRSKKSHKDLLELITATVEFQMRCDCSMRFVRSDKWQKFVASKKMDCLGKIAVSFLLHG